MKKTILLTALIFLLGLTGFSQAFKATFTNPAGTNKLVFSVQPTADITTNIIYFEVAFRYKTATTPAFTVSSAVSNTTNFTGISMVRRPDFVAGEYTYIRYLHTGTIASKLYTSGTTYDFLELTLDATPPSFGDFGLASDLATADSDPNDYIFAILNDGLNLLVPTSGDQFYGPGLTTDGPIQILPLTNVPLPVKFAGFSVAKKDNSAILNWQIENENSNTLHYEVERSTNRTTFKTIATILPKDNGRTSNGYDLTDANLSTLRSSGVVYYRIKQVDKDGKALYTEIKSIRLNSKTFAASVYPNPVKSSASLTLDLVQDAPVSIKVSDAAGKEVKFIQLQGNKGYNLQQIDMSTFAPGNYLLKVQSGSESTILSVVKTK